MADRRGLRYESDLTDAEWALVALLIRPAKRGCRPRTVNVREVLLPKRWKLSAGPPVLVENRTGRLSGSLVQRFRSRKRQTPGPRQDNCLVLGNP